jgi:hypothetical protein
MSMWLSSIPDKRTIWNNRVSFFKNTTSFN